MAELVYCIIGFITTVKSSIFAYDDCFLPTGLMVKFLEEADVGKGNS